MNGLLDAIAHRLLVRKGSLATASDYYRYQRMAQDMGLSLSTLTGPYWWMLVRSRAADVYWSLRP